MQVIENIITLVIKDLWSTGKIKTIIKIRLELLCEIFIQDPLNSEIQIKKEKQ